MPRSEWTPDTLEERPYDVERTKQLFADANERWRAEGRGRHRPEPLARGRRLSVSSPGGGRWVRAG